MQAKQVTGQNSAIKAESTQDCTYHGIIQIQVLAEITQEQANSGHDETIDEDLQ